MSSLKKEALIVFYKDEDPVPQVKTMLELIGYSVKSKHYRKVDDIDTAFADLIVLTTPEPCSNPANSFYNINGLDKMLTKMWRLGVPILGLGDVNSAVMETLNCRTATIENHMLNYTEVHNIKDALGNEYFIPSRHKSTLFLDEIEYYDTKECRNIENSYSFISTVCISPSRSPSYNLPVGIEEKSSTPPSEIPEVEIFLIDTMNYIGIYGAPELFFIEENSHVNYTTKKLIALIISLINSIENEKSNRVRESS